MKRYFPGHEFASSLSSAAAGDLCRVAVDCSAIFGFLRGGTNVEWVGGWYEVRGHCIPCLRGSRLVYPDPVEWMMHRVLELPEGIPFTFIDYTLRRLCSDKS